MSGLTLYSGQNCPACIQADRWLTTNGYAFTKIDVTGKPELIRQLAATTKQRTIPQFFFNGSWLSRGFQDVQALASQGRLG
jgi:glutaredoxin 3